MNRLNAPADLERYRDAVKEKKRRYGKSISVCGGPGCHAQGCGAIFERFREEIAARGLQDSVEVRLSGCHGFCEMGPIAVIEPGEVFYGKVGTDDVSRIVEASIIGGGLVEDLLYRDAQNGGRSVRESDVPFYAGQKRLLMAGNKLINPLDIEDFIAQGGYAALVRALFDLEPEQIIEEVARSGLRGRGGAGFPVSVKWNTCRRAPSRDGAKYVVCNADEGDPGAYMDRGILEGNPHQVIEGMLVGARAIGASEGFVYIRHEYPLAVENLQAAIAQAQELGLLGRDILGSGLDFELNVSLGGGSFVCGEETSLIASIEGKPGVPKTRPPYPASRGLWGKPTNLNNVETWANIPIVIGSGGEAYAGVGTEKSKGTKIFSLVGKIRNTGLVEVPMGMTLREIAYGIGGGIPGGGKLKAVQIGGPSGGCLPESLLDTPVDFDSLREVGAMMGSGGMIIMDETTCMVDIARYFVDFLSGESCGNCVPCREGLKQLLFILNDITAGRGTPEQLGLLRELAEVMRDASLCGLGQTAANPVLSTLRYFEDEYLEHIVDKRCRAGVCKALITFSIDADRCTGCLRCRQACPAGAISGEKKKPHLIDEEKCDKCGICFEVCEQRAVIRK